MELPGRAVSLRILLMGAADVDSTRREQLREIALRSMTRVVNLAASTGCAGSMACATLQIPAFGKKGRMTVAVRLLVEPLLRKVAQACFHAKPRRSACAWPRWARLVLPREQHGDVKLARRPDGEMAARPKRIRLQPGAPSPDPRTFREGRTGDCPQRRRTGQAMTLQRLHHVLDSCAPAAIALSGRSRQHDPGLHCPSPPARSRRHVSRRIGGRPAGRDRTHQGGVCSRENWSLNVVDARLTDERYLANPANRCFFCKSNLYGTLASLTADQLLSGTNLDDLGDWRPVFRPRGSIMSVIPLSRRKSTRMAFARLRPALASTTSPNCRRLRAFPSPASRPGSASIRRIWR
ncbi:MAG: hypothetical protein R3D03_14505 [Geminicoccaceae bacterium]